MDELSIILILAIALILVIWLRKWKEKVTTFFKDAGISDIRWNGEIFMGRLNDLSFEIETECHGRSGWNGRSGEKIYVT